MAEIVSKSTERGETLTLVAEANGPVTVHRQWCRVGGKSTIVPARLRFMTGNRFLKVAQNLTDSFDLFETMKDAFNAANPQFVPLTLEYDAEQEKWLENSVHNTDDLYADIISNRLENSSRLLIPYLELDSTARESLNMDPEKKRLEWPIVSPYVFVANNYMSADFEDWVVEYAKDKDAEDVRFVSAEVLVCMNHENKTTYIVPAELYGISNECEPALLSQLVDEKKSEELKGDNYDIRKDIAPVEPVAASVEYPENATVTTDKPNGTAITTTYTGDTSIFRKSDDEQLAVQAETPLTEDETELDVIDAAALEEILKANPDKIADVTGYDGRVFGNFFDVLGGMGYSSWIAKARIEKLVAGLNSLGITLVREKL